MWLRKFAVVVGSLAVGGAAGAVLQFNAVSAASPSEGRPALASAHPAATPSAASCPAMPLDIAFTSKTTATSSLHLHLPWGRPGDPEGQMIEDYGAFNGTSVREQLPVHDVTDRGPHRLDLGDEPLAEGVVDREALLLGVLVDPDPAEVHPLAVEDQVAVARDADRPHPPGTQPSLFLDLATHRLVLIEQ